MKLISWLRRLFPSGGPEAEAVEREEYGVPDRGEAEVERDRFRGPYPTVEGSDLVEDELESFEPPRDPAP